MSPCGGWDTSGNTKMKSNNDTSVIFDAILRLNEGNYDTPIDTNVSKEFGGVLVSLEDLRVKLRDLRDESIQKINDVDDTIASVAHDLKTPIAVILGCAECIEAGMDDKDYLSLIVKKAEEMNEQVLSIVDANRNKVNPQHFEKISTRQFFKDEFEKYRTLVEGKGIKFKLGKLPDVEIHGDKRSLSAVVLNLMTNGVKYTEKGKISVSFSKESEYLKIKVKDSGQGIDKEDLPKIFDKFYVGDKARTDVKSSGLGLYTVKEAVSHHGGKIGVKSKPKKGTVFTIYLPLEKKDRGKTFDGKSRLTKLIVFTVSYPFNPSFIYRISKASKAGDKRGVRLALLTFPVCYFVWAYDVATIVLENKIHL